MASGHNPSVCLCSGCRSAQVEQVQVSREKYLAWLVNDESRRVQSNQGRLPSISIWVARAISAFAMGIQQSVAP